MILLIDNFDSFAHNLARYFVRLEQPVCVVRNDAIQLDAIREMRPSAIVISPGPCTPREAGASLTVASELHSSIPILGVCLGHQIIAEALGARITRAALPVHGQTSAISHDCSRLFAGIPSPMNVARYHSLIADADSLPNSLRVTAQTADEVVMAFEHKSLPVFGLQFHPESILTEFGYQLLANFLRASGHEVAVDPTVLQESEFQPTFVPKRTLPVGPVTF